MRIASWILAAALVAGAPAARAEDWSSHAISYRVAVVGAPEGLRWQASFKSWTMAGCRKWISSTTMSLNIQAARHVVVQRVELGAEDSLDGPLVQASYRASGDAAKIERRLKATFAGQGGPRLEIEGHEGGRQTALPADTVRPRHLQARLVEELRKGGSSFTLTTLNPAVASGWSREAFEVIESWPYAEEPLPAQIADMLPGRFWYLKTSGSDERSGKAAYIQVHESGIVVRMAGDRNGVTIQHTASKLELLPAPRC